MELCSSPCHQSVISQTILKTMLETNWGELMVVNKVLRQWNPGCPAYAFSAKTWRLPCYPRAKNENAKPCSSTALSTSTLSFFIFYLLVGSNGVTLVRALSSYQFGLGSYPGVDALCGWVEFINGSLPRVERFFFLGFPLSSTDTNFLFQFNQEW